MTRSLKVAVIGAGVAGLVVARELQRESLQVVVFEKSHQLGGTWAYDARVESDLLGIDPNRDVVHSSLYKSLKTNLPRELMSFTDFKFDEKVYGGPGMYTGHEEVLKFLNDFARHFELIELIRFNTLVTRVEVVDLDITEFVVESNTNGVNYVEMFDAVVVCTGRNTQPRLATDIPGIKTWPRKQMHSHNYRVPEPFRDQIVVVIGNGPSAVDISREIAMVAKEVHMSSRSPLVKVAKSDKFNNMWQHSKINCVSEDGWVTFQDGFSIDADIILHCTGYKFHLPFLRTNGIVSVEDKRIGPLYKHVFPPRLAPGLSFVGILERTFPFIIMECQSRWIAHALSAKVSLPSEDEMLSEVLKYYEEMKEKGLPEHSTHQLGFQLDYIDWMWAQTGMVMEKNIRNMIEYWIYCLMTAGIDGYMDLFSQKYGIY
ncbi:putative flavin monooxygenase, FAD/NAD(P)-binding domain superfamily [Helianthus annuus]|uniref:Flavin-containing monooxygenase n=1 Tax=Helianthus annuus TaxID=4232 RepID=A0A251V4F6_HELAN|nr:flavin-containing monooxygenase FMO GS-OX5 isoform X2 [Helianthus annuus]KAF5811791.1 putative flavin monooxygenase, FAD/NAD(P)-binding domain superfamily [Helianthus annuus]KAJ0582418.1 putative flavin monooxygenase, FAD/NAD(P)-binding domain superfamily [Helianthus annuus]KAJ0590651.1 putative flavin monooxygenase, FAD/NAD(P)-binding domain superfamily [Helianthus annuus]KAJ0598400.1 putative flavin monooxygenase, FAD/NAD(P)-binding domain superfamily [Helianthus annuus]KAJ0762659.1 putat